MNSWYIFEQASNPWIQQRLDQINKEISTAYWETFHASEAEKKHQAESLKQETALLKSQAAIIREIGRLQKLGPPPTQAQFDTISVQLDTLSDSIDQLWGLEVRAQARFTGSGPVSRP